MPIRNKDENGLTAIQKKFCDEYIKDFDGKNAYLRANETCPASSAAQIAHELLTKPHIKAYIEKLQKAMFEAQFVNYERIAQELAQIAFHSKNEKNRLQALSLLQKQMGLDKTTITADINQKIDIVVGIEDDAD